MQYDRNYVESMSNVEYVDYLERLYPFPAYGKALRDEIMLQLADTGLGGKEIDEFVEKVTSEKLYSNIFKDKLEGILKSLPEDATSRSRKIPLACVPRLGTPNAESAITPRGDPYIVVDVSLGIFLQSMTKILF